MTSWAAASSTRTGYRPRLLQPRAAAAAQAGGSNSDRKRPPSTASSRCVPSSDERTASSRGASGRGDLALVLDPQVHAVQLLEGREALG